MYLHFKQGFVEADRWDGGETGLMSHNVLLQAQAKHGTGVVVCRSRERETLQYMLESVALQGNGLCQVQESPAAWDYEFRCYLTTKQFQMILCQVAHELDYRNFKSWHTTAANNGPTRSGRTRLAHDIWHAAHDALGHKPSATQRVTMQMGRPASQRRIDTQDIAEFAVENGLTREDIEDELFGVVPAPKCVHGSDWKECVECITAKAVHSRTPDKVRAAKLRTTRPKAKRDGVK